MILTRPAYLLLMVLGLVLICTGLLILAQDPDSDGLCSVALYLPAVGMALIITCVLPPLPGALILVLAN